MRRGTGVTTAILSGGQAVHCSPDFAANGYHGASHGCVNVRDYRAMSSLSTR